MCEIVRFVWDFLLPLLNQNFSEISKEITKVSQDLTKVLKYMVFKGFPDYKYMMILWYIMHGDRLMQLNWVQRQHLMISRNDCAVDLMLWFCRPISASTCSDGSDTIQHVHSFEDTQRQPQPQATVHGERLRAYLPKLLSEHTDLCFCLLVGQWSKCLRPAE